MCTSTQPGVTFARELTDRVRVIACLESRPFLLHSDLPDYGLRSSEWRSLRQRLRASKSDTLVVVWGPEQDVAAAAQQIAAAAQQLNASTEEVAGSASHLAGAAEKLTTAAGGFRVSGNGARSP